MIEANEALAISNTVKSAASDLIQLNIDELIRDAAAKGATTLVLEDLSFTDHDEYKRIAELYGYEAEVYCGAQHDPCNKLTISWDK